MFMSIEVFYKKKKELLLYLFFGGLTFLISVINFVVFNISLNVNELIANILSWIIAVLFAFFTNRIWVFNSPTTNIKSFLKQLISFFGARTITLMIEEIILFIFITRLKFSVIWVKISAQIVVIVTNYVISKKMIFRKKL